MTTPTTTPPVSPPTTPPLTPPSPPSLCQLSSSSSDNNSEQPLAKPRTSSSITAIAYQCKARSTVTGHAVHASRPTVTGEMKRASPPVTALSTKAAEKEIPVAKDRSILTNRIPLLICALPVMVVVCYALYPNSNTNTTNFTFVTGGMNKFFIQQGDNRVLQKDEESKSNKVGDNRFEQKKEELKLINAEDNPQQKEDEYKLKNAGEVNTRAHGVEGNPQQKEDKYKLKNAGEVKTRAHGVEGHCSKEQYKATFKKAESDRQYESKKRKANDGQEPDPRELKLQKIDPEIAIKRPKRGVVFWILVIQWPPSFCNKDLRTRCSVPIPERWTIHSLLPVGINGKVFPRSMSYSKEDLANIDLTGIESLLEFHWPQLKTESAKDFWMLQFVKHGIETGLTPYEFFSKALAMKTKLDDATGRVEDLLKNKKLTPGYSHNFQSVCDVITKSAATPEINCYTNNQGSSQLHEIRFCYNLNNLLVDCNGGIDCYNLNCNRRIDYPSR